MTRALDWESEPKGTLLVWPWLWYSLTQVPETLWGVVSVTLQRQPLAVGMKTL